MPSARIRDASEQDQGVLLRFHKRLYEDYRDQVLSEEDLPLVAYHDYGQILADDLRRLLEDRDAHVLIAELEGKPVGYITGRMTVESRRVLSRRGTVEDWFVEPARRGAGVGASLLRELEKRFTDQGCQVIESATWSNNEGARRVHESLGFRELRIIYRKRV